MNVDDLMSQLDRGEGSKTASSLVAQTQSNRADATPNPTNTSHGSISA